MSSLTEFPDSDSYDERPSPVPSSSKAKLTQPKAKKKKHTSAAADYSIIRKRRTESTDSGGSVGSLPPLDSRSTTKFPATKGVKSSKKLRGN
jgi:hypothetical protein